MSIKINVKKDKDATLPTRGSAAAAGYDLYSNSLETITINPHETKKISTGISVELPEDTFAIVASRSGIATKRGLRMANGIGVIDADYRGVVIVPIHNDTDEPQVVLPKERIAQIIVLPYHSLEFAEVSELKETERGSGGFGSTGVK